MPPDHFAFGAFRLNRQQRLLFRSGELVPLTPKAFDTLLLLVENHGRVVDKDTLIKRVWPDTFVEEGSFAAFRPCAKLSEMDQQISCMFFGKIPSYRARGKG